MESALPPLPALPSEAAPGADEQHGSPSAPRPDVYDRPIPLDLIDPDAVKVLRRLTRAGHQAYLVGGGVRDLLLGGVPKDFDVATSARPNEVRSLFRNCRIIGRRFRLARILFAGGKAIETATFRQEPGAGGFEPPEPVETEAEAEGAIADAGLRPRSHIENSDLLIRHDNVFGEPHEDARRRDFTINGLFYDIDHGQVIDYVGGMADLEARVVRTIGRPEVRFREDPIRMLRAIKFGARCDLGLAPELHDALVDARQELSKGAPPRVLEEILRLLRGGAAHRSVWLAWETGLLSVVLPELSAYLDDDGADTPALFARLSAVDARVARGAAPPDAVLVAALLWGPFSEATDGERDVLGAYEHFVHRLGERLEIPRRMKDRMRHVLMSQRRLVTGRHQSIVARDFFADAALLHALHCESRDESVPEWATAALERAVREGQESPGPWERPGRAEGGAAGDGESRDGGRSRRRRRRR